MLSSGAQALVIGASLSGLAAVAHLACIFIGAPAYRVMGAGERMARAAEAGKPQPALVTLAIACMLMLWSAYALSGAGVIAGFPRLPLTGFVLPCIAAVYIGRAICFPFLKTAFPENSDAFWWCSSSICGVIGAFHAYGTLARWDAL